MHQRRHLEARQEPTSMRALASRLPVHNGSAVHFEDVYMLNEVREMQVHGINEHWETLDAQHVARIGDLVLSIPHRRLPIRRKS
jgi:hypothetical protein